MSIVLYSRRSVRTEIKEICHCKANPDRKSNLCGSSHCKRDMSSSSTEMCPWSIDNFRNSWLNAYHKSVVKIVACHDLFLAHPRDVEENKVLLHIIQVIKIHRIRTWFEKFHLLNWFTSISNSGSITSTIFIRVALKRNSDITVLWYVWFVCLPIRTAGQSSRPDACDYSAYQSIIECYWNVASNSSRSTARAYLYYIVLGSIPDIYKMRVSRCSTEPRRFSLPWGDKFILVWFVFMYPFRVHKLARCFSFYWKSQMKLDIRYLSSHYKNRHPREHEQSTWRISEQTLLRESSLNSFSFLCVSGWNVILNRVSPSSKMVVIKIKQIAAFKLNKLSCMWGVSESYSRKDF